MKQKVVIIGSGNVAQAFAIAIKNNTIFEVVQIFARNKIRGAEIANQVGCSSTSNKEQLAVADLYLIAVKDRAICEVASSLTFPTDSLVAHTAGCGTLENLGELPFKAIIYPFQTFTIGCKVDFSHLPIFIEANNEVAKKKAAEFAHSLTDRVDYADSTKRAVIHLAGVFANNFTNDMCVAAKEVLSSANLDFEILKPILTQTLNKILSTSCPENIQSGPAVRGDNTTMEKHEQMLSRQQTLLQIYKSISKHIWSIKTSKRF